MKNWLRRIRGAVGMGLTWALAWFAAGIALLLVVGVGGLLLSGIFALVAGLGGGGFLTVGTVFTLSGAGSAAGSLMLARMAEEPKLLEGSE